jgi:hypothetical protein
MDGAVVPPAGRMVRLGVVLPADDAAATRLAVLCDRAGVDVVWAPDEQAAAMVAGLVHRATVAVRPATDEPWAATVAVSVGRTAAEARARANLDPAFDGGSGIVGALEDGQARLAALVEGGVTDLRCILPDAPDVHDLVAQLTAMVVGSPTTHRPDRPRSPDPPPPPWAAR